jgi:drug/metabolite transporter superfamily protein YnfA
LAAEPPPKPAPDTLGAAVSEVSERMSLLVREEIELAKAEVLTKASSIARGAAVAAVGAVFGVFALIFGLMTIAWAVADATGYEWIGFAVVFVGLLLLTAFAFLFAWRKLKVGAPKPKMAIDEAKKIRATVSAPESEKS